MPLAQLEAAWHRPSEIEVAQIKRLLPMLRDSLKPASPKSIALWVEFLLSRYPRREEQHDAFSDMDKRAWLTVLGDWPEDVLQAAVMRWLGDDRPFPPRVPGELKKLGDAIMSARRVLIYAGERVLMLPQPEAAQEPPPPDAFQRILNSLKQGLLPPMRGRAR